MNHDVVAESQSTRAWSPRGQEGIILIALLWVLAAVSLLAINLASVVRGETSVAQAGAEAERCYFYARGVSEVALYRLAYADRDPEKRSRMFPYGGGMHHFWMNQDVMLGHVAIFDEAGKMDLNAAKALLRLFETLVIPEEQRAALMEAIEKRRPPAALTSEDTAELRPGPFVSVEELLQIKGLSRATLYGTYRQEGEKTVHKRGLMDFVTVHSGSQRININSAEVEVLASLPGMDLGAAASLVQARQGKPFEASDLAARASGSLSGEALSLISADFSGAYCLIATSGMKGSQVRRSIKVIASLDRKGRLGHHRLAWYDEYWPPRQVIQWLEAQPENLTLPQTAMLTPAAIWKLND
jgi:general secretion pathway protein K